MTLNIKELVALADRLDKAGKCEEADLIDSMLKEAMDLPESISDGLMAARKKDELMKKVVELLSGLDIKDLEKVVGMIDSSTIGKSEEELEGMTQEEIGGAQILCDDADDKLEGGVGDKISYDDLDEKQLEMGQKVEMEHTNDPEIAKEIAKDHLAEQLNEGKDKEDQDYYTLLKKIDPHNKASKKKLFEKLANMADELDSIGAAKEANMIDEFIQKHAEGEYSEDREDEGDTEQSKRYDSKYHHSLQIREPKKEQERIDREGRKNHHVHTYQQANASLSTRYCPDHVGVMVGRVGESTYQCPLDGQVYNWETGWTDYDGNENPGGSVAAQTPDSSGYATPHRIFDSRENILNTVN